MPQMCLKCILFVRRIVGTKSHNSGLGCSNLLLNLTTGLANQGFNLITVGYLTSGQIFVAQNEFNQWLANHCKMI